MKLKNLALLLGVLLLIVAGCGKAPEAAGEPQKQALNTYLEGMRDLDTAKLAKSTHAQVYASWPQEPAELRKFLANNQTATGSFKSWQFEEPYVDELNGQTLIRTSLVSDKYKFLMDFDLRKQLNNVWGVYGFQMVKQVALSSSKGKTPTNKMTP